MAKSTKKNVKAVRNGVEKEFTAEQWKSMKTNNASYGWKSKSDLSDEVLQKDDQIENEQVKTLQKQVDDLTKENETFISEGKAKDDQIKDLQKQVDDLTKDSKSKKK